MSEQSHRSDPRILNRRTLQKDHRYLAKVLRTGMHVLDVGCGTGTITSDIASKVGPDGTAVGIDRDDSNLAIAVQAHGGMGNIRFEAADILTLGESFNNRFDIVTAARTIQWISEPERAILAMKKAAKPGGLVMVLDYNLDETYWEPDPPADFKRFYRSLLDWRRANNWDNRTASHLAEWLHSAGLLDITTHPSDELIQRGDSDFLGAHTSGIWLYAVQSLGPNLVQAGFLDEGVRLRAEEYYQAYVEQALSVQRHSMLTVEGRVPS